MSMIDRYKKKGGFVQLLNLIETSGKEKAEKFLKLIGEESPAWEAEIRKKVISIDRLLTWNQTYLMEVFPRLPHAVTATGIFNLPPEKQQIFLASLGFSDRRKVEDLLKEAKPNPGEIASCQMKILTEVRNMVSQGHLKMEKVDPELAVPENIEELLMQASKSGGFTGAGPIVDLTADAPPPSHSTSSGGGVGIGAGVGAAPAGGAPGGASSEEVNQLRRRVMQLTQENATLKAQLQQAKEKIDSIRKLAA